MLPRIAVWRPLQDLTVAVLGKKARKGYTLTPYLFLPVAAIPVLETFSFAFQKSDLFARAIVVFLLLVSTYAWIFMLNKWYAVRRARRDNGRFNDALVSAGSPLRFMVKMGAHSGPLHSVYQAGIRELTAVLGGDRGSLEKWARENALPRELSSSEGDLVRNAMQRAADSVLYQLERGLAGLNTIVTVSPFLGLLGTVWGVMLTFTQMAVRTGRPDIRAMAPGVSGALLTTVVGLLVAIPALVGYNVLTQIVRQIATEMDCFTEEFIVALRAETSRGESDFSVRRRKGEP